MDEDIGQNCGKRCYSGGELTEEYVPESEKEAVEFACGVWDYDPSDMDLCLNANGTEYICVESEEYQAIELFDKPALFANKRLTDQDIPAGLYCYHLRHGDDGEFVSLEPGGTMLQAVSMRPDLYAAYLHDASQWDGTYDSVAENGTAVYIFMAENDEYYGSQKARDAYDNLHAAYEAAGWTDEQIDSVLKLEIPDNEYFRSQGIYGNYHGGNILFEDESILNWIISHRK